MLDASIHDSNQVSTSRRNITLRFQNFDKLSVLARSMKTYSVERERLSNIICRTAGRSV